MFAVSPEIRRIGWDFPASMTANAVAETLPYLLEKFFSLFLVSLVGLQSGLEFSFPFF